MNYVNVASMDIAYEAGGEGPALVLLHGFLSDHRDWRPQLDGLSGDFRVIAWDAPGCGQSPDPPEAWRMPQYADCLAGFLAAIGVESAHIAGISWGGTLAQELYRRYPATVRSLVLADSYAGWGASLGEQAGQERLELCLRLSTMEPAELISRLKDGMMTESAPAHVVEELSAIMASFHPSGFRTMSHAVAEADTRDVWPMIDVPTLLIWGEQDARSPLFVAEAFREGIEGAQLVIVPGGHVSNMESPAAFNDAVREFIRSVEAATTSARLSGTPGHP